MSGTNIYRRPGLAAGAAVAAVLLWAAPETRGRQEVPDGRSALGARPRALQNPGDCRTCEGIQEFLVESSAWLPKELFWAGPMEPLADETLPDARPWGIAPIRPVPFYHPEWRIPLKREFEEVRDPWPALGEEPVDYFLTARYVDPNEMLGVNVTPGISIGFRIDLLGPAEIPETERLLLETGQDPVRLSFMSTSLGISIDF